MKSKTKPGRTGRSRSSESRVALDAWVASASATPLGGSNCRRAAASSAGAKAAAGANNAADASWPDRLATEWIIDAVSEPLLVVGRDLRVLRVNRSFASLFELSDRDLVGLGLGDIGSKVWNLPELLRRLACVSEDGSAMEELAVRYDSEALGPRSLLVNARGCGRRAGEPEFIVVVVADVTERQRVQGLLREHYVQRLEDETVRQRQLELSNALRVSTVGELATGLAHELSQPLSSISNIVEACAQYLRAGTIDSAKLLGLLSQAAAESLRAAGIVDNLRACVGNAEPRCEPVDLGELVRSLPDLLLRELERAKVALHLDLPARRLHVHADRIQIEQVIVNLIQNGMDSIQEADGPRRLIELSARRADRMALVSVRDTGTGIPGPAA